MNHRQNTTRALHVTVSLALAVSLVFCSLFGCRAAFAEVVTSGAGDEGHGKLEESRADGTLLDYSVLSCAGLDVDLVESVSFKGNNPVYKFVYDGGYISDVEVSSLSGGSYRLDITEGDLCDSVLIKSDGSLVVDGLKIQGRDTSSAFASASESGVSTHQFVASVSSNDPLRGKAKYIHEKTVKVANMALPKVLNKMTLSTIISVASKALPGAGGVAVKITATAFNYLVKQNPSAKALSSVQSVSKPPRSAYAGGFTSVAKAVTTYYSKTNYKGSKTKCTSYYYTSVC